MRYTTIIDITDYREIYRNVNARLVYLHLVLSCGYHDYDRDISALSIRQLAADAGVTVAACRHALKMLARYKLVTMDGGAMTVKKWIPGEEYGSRPTTPKTPKNGSTPTQTKTDVVAQQYRDDDRDRQRAETERTIAETGKTPFMLHYEEQLRQAAKGDAAALEYINKPRWRMIYEGHKKQLEEQRKK